MNFIGFISYDTDIKVKGIQSSTFKVKLNEMPFNLLSLPDNVVVRY